MRGPTTELQPIIGATIGDLNENLIREHITVAVRRRAYPGATDVRSYLLRHHCGVDSDGQFIPTMAGILTYARDPNAWIPHAGIDVVQFDSPQPNSTKMLLSRQVRGDMSSVIDQTAELLWARTEHRISLRGTSRVEEDSYPLVVLRELTANSMMHRDWGISGARVRIQIFPDRIEWVSPGGFPGRRKKISFETLLTEHHLRNHHLAQLLYNAGKIEAFGIGMDSVAEAMRYAPRTPVVTSSNDFFSICVWGKRLGGEQVPPEPSEITPRQEQILALLQQATTLTAQALAEALDEMPRTIQRDLRNLLDAGLIVAEGNTRNRCYRRTETNERPERS